ncbi:MAG: hypothetical protein WD316_08980 [Phycisphaeraceae bacterium]
MALVPAGKDPYEALDELQRAGQLGLELGVIVYGVARDRASCVALMNRMRARRIVATVVDPEMVDVEVEALASGLEADERDRVLRCGLSLWRVDQDPMLLEAVVRYVDEVWLRPAGARLLGIWAGGSQPGAMPLAPGRHFSSSPRPEITWANALTRMRRSQLPCEYFVTGLASDEHAREFMAEFEHQLTADEPGLVERLPMWTTYRIDRQPVREVDEVEYDAELRPWVVLPDEQQHVGVHLHGTHDSTEHKVVCMLLQAVADEVGARFEGAIRPNVDVYRQYR